MFTLYGSIINILIKPFMYQTFLVKHGLTENFTSLSWPWGKSKHQKFIITRLTYLYTKIVDTQDVSRFLAWLR
jgi:hypothetical protein